MSAMDPYFRELYGSRWPTLKSALKVCPLRQPAACVALKLTHLSLSLSLSLSTYKRTLCFVLSPPSVKEEVRHIALVNPFCRTSEHERRRQLGEATANVMGLQVHSRAEPKDGSGGTYPVPPSDQAGVKAWYWMDLASLLPPLALRIGETDAVLDVCAAPGGKSIVMAQRLFRRHRVGSGAEGQAAGGCLVCNEMSASRRKRLNGVVSDYLPADVRSRVRLTGCDGTKLREHGVYDKVLVDAPCSSERHILMQKGPSRDHRSSRSKASPPVIDRWSPKQCKSFAKTQVGLCEHACYLSASLC